MIEFDDAKDRSNQSKHGVPLVLAEYLFLAPYEETLDDREDYGEQRFIARGMINGLVFVCVFTWREGVRRIISLRRATKRESDDFYKAHGIQNST